MRRVTVQEYEAGLRYVDGRFVGLVGPGRYWETNLLRRQRVVVVDLRLRSLAISGQEIVTKDKANVRITVAVQYRVTDAAKAVHEVQNYQDALYQDIQLALRGIVAQMDLDALLESRDEVDQALMTEVGPAAAGYGLELVKVGLKDVILPGELRTIMNRVVEARKAAEANLVAAREEVAAARARQNVAAIVREHPAVLELLRLETMKDMAKARGNTFVFGTALLPPTDSVRP